MLIYCVFVCIMYYPVGEGFFPRNLKLSNSYRSAVTTMFLLNHTRGVVKTKTLEN